VSAKSGWSLAHYQALAAHLEHDYRRIASVEDRYVAYALAADGGRARRPSCRRAKA
jgi:hypothetical protein